MGDLPPIEYSAHFIVQRVTNAGAIRFKTRLVFIANALKEHPIVFEEVEDGIWSIHHLTPNGRMSRRRGEAWQKQPGSCQAAPCAG